MSEEKWCCSCRRTKTKSEFNKCKVHKDGLQSFCRSCQHEYAIQYYKGHRKEHLARMEKWQRENPEYMKERRETHREEDDAGVKEWRRRNPERFKKIRTKTHIKHHRNLGWVELYPNPFAKCELIDGHHINNIHIVFLPRDLHQLDGAYSGVNTEQHRENLSYIVSQIYGGS